MTTTTATPTPRTNRQTAVRSTFAVAPARSPRLTQTEKLREAEAAGYDTLLKLIYKEMRDRQGRAFDVDKKTGLEQWKLYTLYTPLSAISTQEPEPHHISRRWTVILNPQNLPYRLDSEYGAKKFIGCPDQIIVSEYNAAAQRRKIGLRVVTKHEEIAQAITGAIAAGMYRWEKRGAEGGREAGWYSVPMGGAK